MTQILDLIGLLPQVVSLVERAVERYEKSQRVQKENERRKQIDKALEEDDEEAMRKEFAGMLSNIRRNVSD